jgi:hypothetical protein
LNNERFIPRELKELENVALTALDRQGDLKIPPFLELRYSIAENTQRILLSAHSSHAEFTVPRPCGSV